MTDQGAERFDPGWLIEGEHGEALDLSKLPFIVQDRIDRYPDPEEMTRWIVEHPGVYQRQVEEEPGAWSLFLRDEANDIELVFGEFNVSELAP